MQDKIKNRANVERNNDTIIIHNFDHAKCVSDFLYKLKEAIERAYSPIIIKSDAHSVFPNACLPIAGILQQYISLGININFELLKDSYLLQCGFSAPYAKSREEIQKEINPFDKIYRYETSGQVADLAQAMVDSISHQSICEEGVLGGLSWCLSEVMDNVLVHSETKYGYVMGQYHPTTKHVAICVYDSGVGIYASLRNSKHRPRTEIDSLALAIQEGVGDGKGQGNGLYGLYKVVHDNFGSLTVTSGASSIMMINRGALKKYEYLPYLSKSNKGTIVDFQLDLNKPIDIKHVFTSIGGIDDFDIRLDNMVDEQNRICYDIFKDGQGTATREAGAYLRNDIENAIIRTHSRIVLNFSNVKTVSSSFIDELISKLIIDLGFVKFNNFIKIEGMNEDIEFLCNRSIYMRIYQTWQSNSRKQ